MLMKQEILMNGTNYTLKVLLVKKLLTFLYAYLIIAKVTI